MTDLSPAAQAVWDAAYNTPEDCPYEHDLAAALEAVADQVVPAEEAMPLNLAHRVRWDAMQSVRYQLLAIAAELKA
jgi:hypothetical protein